MNRILFKVIAYCFFTLTHAYNYPHPHPLIHSHRQAMWSSTHFTSHHIHTRSSSCTKNELRCRGIILAALRPSPKVSVCTHTHAHTYTQTHTHTSTHTRTHTRAKTHTRTHTHTRARANTHAHAREHARIHSLTHSHTREHTHTHMHARTHTLTHSLTGRRGTLERIATRIRSCEVCRGGVGVRTPSLRTRRANLVSHQGRAS